MKIRGITLIVCLIFLTLLSMLGASALTATGFNEKMTSNALQRNLSFQSADSSLRNGEQWLFAQSAHPAPVAACGTPPCQVWQANILPTLASQSDTWWQLNGTPFNSSLGSGIKETPVYILEESLFVPDDLNPSTTTARSGTYYYTVTAEGVGPTTDSQAIVQSIYATRYN